MCAFSAINTYLHLILSDWSGIKYSFKYATFTWEKYLLPAVALAWMKMQSLPFRFFWTSYACLLRVSLLTQTAKTSYFRCQIKSVNSWAVL